MMDDSYPVRWAGRQTIVTLPGHIDVSNAGPIREQLLSVINRGPDALVADMNATISCDNAGADAIVRAYQRALASGTEVRLVVTSGVVRRVLGASGVDRLVPVYPSLEAALAAGAPVPPSWPATGTGAEMALLDSEGVIASVNQAWTDFAQANDGDPAGTGPGVSYLQACDLAGDDPAAKEVAVAIRAALAGELPGPLRIEVPCHSPATERWFDVLISPRTDAEGATVTLSLARTRPVSSPAGARPDLRLVPQPGVPAEAAHPRRATAAGARTTSGRSPGPAPAVVTPGSAGLMIDALRDGIALCDSHGVLMVANRQLEEMFGYQDGELYGLAVEQLVPAHLQRVHRRHRAGYAHAPAPRPMGTGARLVGMRKDGSTFPAEISLSPVQTATGRLTLTVIRDVTSGRPRPERPAATPAGLPASRDLLDHVTSCLFHLGLSLQNAAGLSPDIAGDHLTGSLGILDDLIREIRDAAFASDGTAIPAHPESRPEAGLPVPDTTR